MVFDFLFRALFYKNEIEKKERKINNKQTVIAVSPLNFRSRIVLFLIIESHFKFVHIYNIWDWDIFYFVLYWNISYFGTIIAFHRLHHYLQAVLEFSAMVGRVNKEISHKESH